VNNIPPINKGIQVLEKGSNFLSGVFFRWLQSVESRLNRAVVTDANGNVAYGGAVIPDDVSGDFLHIFYPNSMCRVIYRNLKYIYDSDNAYIRDDNGVPRWQYIGSGEANIFGVIDAGNDTRKFNAIDNGGKLPSGQDINWTQLFWIDNLGNVNIKTGSTYTATL
jgi:hypothetical protein